MPAGDHHEMEKIHRPTTPRIIFADILRWRGTLNYSPPPFPSSSPASIPRIFPRLYSKTTISIGKYPSAKQKHPFADSKIPYPRQKIRRMLAILPAKPQNYIKEYPGAWKKR
ncbi:hypothetical protein Mlab_0692 [Methanocorpusculum labreanum Z]|uniref:Uncharacterized protein n=1 Tax=Methanocorpusculum labreanum (strain ATCC 43576 / DSM 4855 / Z) TaxID=410358 RepID=A2SRA8_METLZ|nr:hypothetical protein Mlab_0692 [Methanocorpusculum labreanum Z]